MRFWSWPIAVVILSSFAFGALWGWKLIRDRNESEGRIDADSQIRILAPAGLLNQELLLAYQKAERTLVDVATEEYPAALLRRALKASPGQFDLVFIYHHQVSSLRVERKMRSLFDERNKFPTIIAPDFRRLPEDRNLMDTAPLLWGLLGVAAKGEIDEHRLAIGAWPAPMIGLDWIGRGDTELTTNGIVAIATSLYPRIKTPYLKALPATVETPLVVSHGQLAYPPLKDMGLEFKPVKGRYPLWILTAVATADGQLERARRMVKFLIAPENNGAFVTATRGGASTLRDQEGSQELPVMLRAGHLRTFSIDQISVERDDRHRQADEIFEQLVLGAVVKVDGKADAAGKGDSKSGRKAPAKKVEPEFSEPSDEVAEPKPPSTAPSEAPAHGD